MQLHITRDQSKGFMGGVKFELEAKVDLTQEEADLVKRYKADKAALMQKVVSVFGREISFDLKVDDLVKGQSFSCNDIGDILETESNVKEACETFKTYLEVMKSFGGRETIEYS